MARILIIDDEEPIRFSLRGILEDEGYEVLEAATAEEGLEVADAERPDLVFLDIWLPGMDGLTAQARLKGNHPDLPVVMISGHGTIETAVSAIQQGAYDFIEKPLSLEKVVIVAARALEAGSLRRENQVLRTVLPEQDELIGQSPVMLKFQELLARVAPTDVWVLLTGENGVVLTAVNAWGYTLEQSYETERFPTEGDGLRLTIDSCIQHYLENALSYAVQEHHVAARAVGIVMDVNTGAVLAMSTTPSYDPNEPRVIADTAARNTVEALTGDARKTTLQLAQQTQWRNKAVSDLYEPGSVFKLITCAAALDAGAITKHSSFYCGESISVAGTRFHCANHKRHGAQSVTQALENSCNQSFIQIGARLGKEAFCDYFAAFGLREPTGVDLPAEPKKSLYYTADRMGPVELASCAFGQSSKISYMEMAAAVCAVVNGGRLMQPYLVSDILNPDGSILQHTEPVCRRQVIKPETSETMREMMEAVVLYGGGRNARIQGYRVGGKSGTSQKLDSADEKARIASFVAVAPIDDPQFLCLVCLDEPHSWTTSGGALSGPVCAEVLQKALPYLGIEPTEMVEK